MSADFTLRAITTVSGLLLVAIVVGIFAELAMGSASAWQTFGLAFLWDSAWNPVMRDFGALPLIYGSTLTAAIALGLAGTVGILGAAYLADFAPPPVGRFLGATIELLAAVPSVVFGLWGLFVLAPFARVFIDPPLQNTFGWLPIFSGTIFGTSLFTAGMILAIMIVPTVTTVAHQVLVAVPRELREASISLGATRWETTWRIVLTSARGGLFGAVILALGRALGEAVAVSMVIGNKPAIAVSVFAPADTMASSIVNEFAEATAARYRSSLFAIGLTLFVVSLIANAVGRFLTVAVARSGGGMLGRR